MKVNVHPYEIKYAPLNREHRSNIPFIPYLLGQTFSSDVLANVKVPDGQALNSYQFEYVTDGVCNVEMNGSTYTFGAGELFYIKKSYCRKLSAQQGAPLQKLFLNVRGPFADAVISQYLPDDAIISCKADFSEYFLNMIKLCENAEETEDVLVNNLCVEFIKIVHKMSEMLKKKKTSSDIVCSAENIMYYIDSNLQNNFSLEDLSEKFFLSRSQIVNIFKHKFNTTPMKYALERRVELAKYYLSKTSIPICEIPHMLPFGNSQYFSSVFKKYSGISPRAYRNKHQSK